MLQRLDPFFWFDKFWFRYVGRPKTAGEEAVYFIAEVFYAILVAYLMYLLLGLILHTPRPAVIVASQSMEPTLWPGDIAIVEGVLPSDIKAPEVDVNAKLRDTPLDRTPIKVLREGVKTVGFLVNGKKISLERNGDIIVYYNDVYRKDIIHRAVLKIKAADGWFFLTKGDNEATNPAIDEDCDVGLCIYPYPVPADHVLGKVIFVIPRIGIIKLWIAELMSGKPLTPLHI